jgi:tRNA (adenine37-N6)-methyltransferase
MSEPDQLDLRSTIIGIVRSPYLKHEGTPIQPNLGMSCPAEIHVHSEYRAGLLDLEGFERIWILAWLDRAKPYCLRVVPYRDTVERGLFATRAPSRPCPIGISCVKIVRLRLPEGIIDLESVDLLDGTPVLDIKPYVPEFDAFPDAKHGWYAVSEQRTTADNRFT